jgi:hypothetical protein
MYLGAADHDRRKQLHSLDCILAGYVLALHQHGIGQEDLKVVADLEDFLRKQSGADNLRGIDQILATSASGEDAWTRVWDLIEQFRTLQGHEA